MAWRELNLQSIDELLGRLEEGSVERPRTARANLARAVDVVTSLSLPLATRVAAVLGEHVLERAKPAVGQSYALLDVDGRVGGLGGMVSVKPKPEAAAGLWPTARLGALLGGDVSWLGDSYEALFLLLIELRRKAALSLSRGFEIDLLIVEPVDGAPIGLDGPSLGLSAAMALLSLVLGRPPDATIALSASLTREGAFGVVGGARAKRSAAARCWGPQLDTVIVNSEETPAAGAISDLRSTADALFGDRWWCEIEPLGEPFRGLAALDEHHSASLEAREPEVAQALELLDSFGHVVVHGTSGVGKTSLVRAGILPALSRRRGGPIKVIDGGARRASAVEGDIAETVALLGAAAEGTGVVVVDGVESLMTPDEARGPDDITDRRSTLNQLVSSLRRRNVAFVLVVRSDALEVLERWLTPHLDARAVLRLREPDAASLGRFVHAQLVEAVGPPGSTAEPTRRRREAKLIDPELVERLVTAVVDSRGLRLPTLALALKQLSTHLGPPPARIDLQLYQALGGLDGVLAATCREGETLARERYLKRVGKRLDDRALLRLLAVLFDIDDELSRPVRRAATLDELVGRHPDDRWKDVCASFDGSGLLRWDERTIEIEHEVLLTVWPIAARAVRAARESKVKLRPLRDIIERDGERPYAHLLDRGIADAIEIAVEQQSPLADVAWVRAWRRWRRFSTVAAPLLVGAALLSAGLAYAYRVKQLRDTSENATNAMLVLPRFDWAGQRGALERALTLSGRSLLVGEPPAAEVERLLWQTAARTSQDRMVGSSAERFFPQAFSHDEKWLLLRAADAPSKQRLVGTADRREVPYVDRCAAFFNAPGRSLLLTKNGTRWELIDPEGGKVVHSLERPGGATPLGCPAPVRDGPWHRHVTGLTTCAEGQSCAASLVTWTALEGGGTVVAIPLRDAPYGPAASFNTPRAPEHVTLAREAPHAAFVAESRPEITFVDLLEGRTRVVELPAQYAEHVIAVSDDGTRAVVNVTPVASGPSNTAQYRISPGPTELVVASDGRVIVSRPASRSSTFVGDLLLTIDRRRQWSLLDAEGHDVALPSHVAACDSLGVVGARSLLCTHGGAAAELLEPAASWRVSRLEARDGSLEGLSELSSPGEGAMLGGLLPGKAVVWRPDGLVSWSIDGMWDVATMLVSRRGTYIAASHALGYSTLHARQASLAKASFATPGQPENNLAGRCGPRDAGRHGGAAVFDDTGKKLTVMTGVRPPPTVREELYGKVPIGEQNQANKSYNVSTYRVGGWEKESSVDVVDGRLDVDGAALSCCDHAPDGVTFLLGESCTSGELMVVQQASDGLTWRQLGRIELGDFRRGGQARFADNERLLVSDLGGRGQSRQHRWFELDGREADEATVPPILIGHPPWVELQVGRQNAIRLDLEKHLPDRSVKGIAVHGPECVDIAVHGGKVWGAWSRLSTPRSRDNPGHGGYVEVFWFDEAGMRRGNVVSRDDIEHQRLVAVQAGGFLKSAHLATAAPRLALTWGVGVVDVWDLPSRQRLSSFTTPQADLEAALPSPDGRRVVVIKRGAPPEVWDVTSEKGRLLMVLEGATGASTATWSPDGRYVATTSPAAVDVFDLSFERLFADMCSSVREPSPRVVEACAPKTVSRSIAARLRRFAYPW